MSFSLGSSPLAALLGGFLAVGVVLLTRKVECRRQLPSGGRAGPCHAEPFAPLRVNSATNLESRISARSFAFAQDDDQYATSRFALAIPQNSRRQRLGKPSNKSHRLCRWTDAGAKIVDTSSTGRASGFDVSPQRGRNRPRKTQSGATGGRRGTVRAPDCDGVSDVTCVVSRRRCWPVSGAAPPANSLFRLVY